MLAPIRLTNAAAQLVLRTQVRRKETHPLPTPHHSRPYAALGATNLTPHYDDSIHTDSANGNREKLLIINLFILLLGAL
jgi:hypothetical protein